MKNILFLLLMFLLSNNSFSQEVFDEASMTLEAGRIINEANARVVRTDTTINLNVRKTENPEPPIIDAKWARINYYDSNNKLVMSETKPLYRTPATSALPDIRIYDANNNCILECCNDLYGVTWLLSLRKYNDMGILTENKYWNMESIAKMVYDNPKNPKKYTLYNSDGKKVKSLKKARRKIPYKMPK